MFKYKKDVSLLRLIFGVFIDIFYFRSNFYGQVNYYISFNISIWHSSNYDVTIEQNEMTTLCIRKPTMY